MDLLRSSAAAPRRPSDTDLTTSRLSGSYQREAQAEQTRRTELASTIQSILKSADPDTTALQSFLSKSPHAALARDENGRTPLHTAAELSRTAALDMLITRKEVDIDAVDSSKQTALHLAVANGSRKCVERLLRAGADAQLVDDKGHLARWYVPKGKEGQEMRDLFDNPPRVVKRGGGGKKKGKGKENRSEVEFEACSAVRVSDEEEENGGAVTSSVPEMTVQSIQAVDEPNIRSVSSVPEVVFTTASVEKAQAKTYNPSWEGKVADWEQEGEEDDESRLGSEDLDDEDAATPAPPPQGMQKKLCEAFQGSFWEPNGDPMWTHGSVWDLVYDDGDEAVRRRGAGKKWFHLSATSIDWAKDLARNICAERSGCTGEQSKDICRYMAEVFKDVDHEGPIRKHHFDREWSDHCDLGKDEMYAVVLPIIDVDKQGYLHLARTHHSDPDDPHLKNMMQLSTLFNHPLPRSLDQSYHEYLDNDKIQRLDHDQVLARYIGRLRTNSSKEKISNDLGSAEDKDVAHNDLITVPHFWLFKIDSNTIITLYPERWDNENESRLHDHVLGLVNSNCGNIYTANFSDNVAATILKSCLSFEAKAFAKCPNPRNPREFHDVEVTYSKGYANSIAEMYMQLCDRFEKLKEGLGSISKDPTEFYREVKEETKILINADDNIAEINMIKRILRNQTRTIDMFRRVVWPDREWIVGGLEEKFPAFEVFEQLETEAERVRAMAVTILDLRQREAAIEDTLNQGEQSTMLFIFTTVTVLFSPLSLVCGILAMPVAGFPESWDASPLAKVFGFATLGTAGLCVLMWALYKLYQAFEVRQRNKERRQTTGRKAGQQPGIWPFSGFQGSRGGLGMRFRGSKRREDLGEGVIVDGRTPRGMGQMEIDPEKGV
ncbi:hypothetical protein QBC37DRAFT_395472 [Rhypophila decipiens]|uniref:Ankyrin repeat protein n=1 Tax=Rhypophila decipiens TaxID=261697 RepID=A0AAN6YJH5_9PEZI|nr:hypothetical protein QBC37DRAFT_395472 [Rhypophila decipiens]